MQPAQPLDTVRGDIHLRLAQQLVREESATHADFAVDPPDRELDSFGNQGLLPGEHMLVDAVDKGSIQIKNEHGPDGHRISEGSRRSAAPKVSGGAAAGYA